MKLLSITCCPAERESREKPRINTSTRHGLRPAEPVIEGMLLHRSPGSAGPGEGTARRGT